MNILLGPLLAMMVLVQAQPARTATGEVVDDEGKAVADAQVVLYAPPLLFGKENAAEARTTTDALGRFRLNTPALGRTLVNGVNYLAYRPGLALSANAYFRRPHRLVLQEPEPRTVKIEGTNGKPVAGARIAPRILSVFGGTIADIPEDLAAPLTVTTGADGRATLNYLSARDQLVAVRVAADPIGTQEFLLVERPGRSSVEPVITITLKQTSRLAGRVVDEAGQPVVNQMVEVWSKGGGNWLPPNLVELRGGPLRTTADGRFQTPDNLLVGSTYRIAVRAVGKEPIISDWLTVGEQPRTLLPMPLRSLRTVSGRMVDRQGVPVANVEVFQTGDGPEPTSTRTGADGRFSLDGFRQGPVFLFARGEGFRFHGQLVREVQRDVQVELTGLAERPAREMRMLGELIPLEESRALARRLAEPCWKVVVEKGDDRAKFETLQALAQADPAGVLEKLESAKFGQGVFRARLQQEVVVALADRDPEEAAAVAESIADPADRAGALIGLIDALPAAPRERKLTLLDRAALHARAASSTDERLRWMGAMAERWYELGEVDKAKAFFAEGLRAANQFTDKTSFRRGIFAAQLAKVDLPAALAIARDFKGDREGARILANMAYRLIEQSPAEAERIWKESLERGGRIRGTDDTLAWKLATVDPTRARRVIEGFPAIDQLPELFVFLALGARERDEASARQAFDEALRRIDRLMEERPERFRSIAGSLLPFVERIDPSRVPEVFWRAVASRPPFGNPRTINAYSPSYLIHHLAWYDREVAAALFEPSQARMEHTEDRELATWSNEFLAWSLFDPRAAVARLEQVSLSSDPGSEANSARTFVASFLELPYEARWRKIWSYWEIILGGPKRGL